MRVDAQRAVGGSRNSIGWGFALFVVLTLATPGRGDDFASLCADRTAIERVYFQHRLGEKLPFEQASPPALIARLVRDDLTKEIALRKNYSVEIAPAMVEAEVRRIEATTRAPEMLAEIKAALGNDPARFARAVARPIVVDRTLRARFENDDALHAPQRALAEEARARLLAAPDTTTAAALLRETSGGTVTEIDWQLTPRPVTDHASPSASAATPTIVSAQSGAYSIEASAQLAQVLSAPVGEADRKVYFEDLDPVLQRALRAALRKPGDVGPVVETPGSFLLHVATARSETELSAAMLAVPKQSFEQWIADQTIEPVSAIP